MTDYLTHADVAARLGHSERWLRDWLKAHPQDRDGRLFYCPAGRVKLFDDNDVTRIKEHMRCLSALGRRGRAKARTGRSAAPTSASTLNELAALLNEPSLAKSPTSSSAPSKPETTRRAKLSLVKAS